MSKLIETYFYLSELQLIESALNLKEKEAVNAFNSTNFASLKEITEMNKRYDELRRLKSNIHETIMLNKVKQ